MTFDEIMVQVTANKTRHEIRLREKAMFDYQQANLNMYMNDPQKMPSFEKAYPFIKQEVDEKKFESVQDEHEVPMSETPYNMQEDQAIFLTMAKSVQRYNEFNNNEGGE